MQAKKNPLEQARLAGNAHTHALSSVYAAISALRNDKTIDTKDRSAALRRLYSKLSWRDVRATVANEVERKRIGVSFRSSISHMRLVKHELRKKGYALSPGGNPKMQDRDFAQALGVPTPKTLSLNQTASEVSVEANTVIKPITGAASKGVFIVDSKCKVRSVYTGKAYESFLEGVNKEYAGTHLATEPVWLTETLIGNPDAPARDIKVFCFYGQPGLIEEIHRNSSPRGKNEYCFYYPSGEKVHVDSNRARYDGSGFPASALEYASRISEESPVPFLRVDFLESEGTLALGEITPQPGGTYAGQIHDHIDRELGELFLEAEARLIIDLLNGKKFDTYFECYPAARPSAKMD